MKSSLRITQALIFLGGLLVSLETNARLNEFAQTSPAPANQFSSGPSLGINGIYKFLDDATLRAKVEYLKGVRTVVPGGTGIGFGAGEPVAIKFLSNGDVQLDLILGEGEDGVIPDTIIISGQEFDKSGLRFAAYGNVDALRSQYSNEEDVREARRGGGRSRGRVRKHHRWNYLGKYFDCVGWVCEKMGGNFCSGTVGGGKGMTNYLVSKKGWRRAHGAACQNPPIGTIASWTGGNGHRQGHTGLWNGSGYCYDEGCGDPGSKFRFKDCAIPPGR